MVPTLLIWSLAFKLLAAQTCNNYQQCKGATVTSGGCYGYSACQSATITAGTAQCRGMYACSSATITSSTVYCWGESGCNAAKIKAVTVQGWGYNSLNSADVEPKANALSVTLNGYKAGTNLDIRCYEGDVCTIDCRPTEGCISVKAYCFKNSQCNIKCGDKCPQLYSSETGFPDPEIWNKYYENQEKKKNLPNDDEFPLDYPDDDDHFTPKPGVISLNLNMIWVLLLVFGFCLGIGLCILNIKTWKESKIHNVN